MFLSIKVKSYVIQASSAKEAYLKGCKNLANVIASKKYPNLSFKVERPKDNSSTFIFNVYTNVELGPAQKEFCKTCKEFHCQFYINEDWNCSRCNMKAFLKIMEDKAKISRGFYKDRLKE